MLAEGESRAPFQMILLQDHVIFLPMMNDLFLATGTPSSVSAWPCLSLMVQVSLLETVFITCLLYLAPTYALGGHSLFLCCTSPRKCCPTAYQEGNKGLGLTPGHLPALKVPGTRETELNGCLASTRAARNVRLRSNTW